MKRRSFLINSGLATTAAFVPRFLLGKSNATFNSRGKKLVVIQLSGGNDGLNTIVPFNNDIYYKSRPGIALKKSNVLNISDEFGLNPALESLRPFYDNGMWSIINNVGYPNPDRSHFRSMDIWHTASDSDEYLTTGWLGRYLDHNCSGSGDAHMALEVSEKLSLSLKGERFNGFVMKDSRTLKKSLENPFVRTENSGNHNDKLTYLYKVLADTKQSAEYLHEKSKIYKSKTDYPKHQFGKSLKMVAELISSGNDSSIYYLSLGSFDTHAFQNATQARLLTVYANAVAAFMNDLKKNDKQDEVLIMTFSEFGRRVSQNASNGTDHGTANNIFLMGNDLKKPGMFSDEIDLENLDNGDLKFKIDFREIYADLLYQWMGGENNGVVKNKFKGLGLV